MTQAPQQDLALQNFLPAHEKKAEPGGGEAADREDAINISGIARALIQLLLF